MRQYLIRIVLILGLMCFLGGCATTGARLSGEPLTPEQRAELQQKRVERLEGLWKIIHEDARPFAVTLHQIGALKTKDFEHLTRAYYDLKMIVDEVPNLAGTAKEEKLRQGLRLAGRLFLRYTLMREARKSAARSPAPPAPAPGPSEGGIAPAPG